MAVNSHPIEETGAFYIDEDGIRSVISTITKFTKSKYSISASFEGEFQHKTDDVSTLIAHPQFKVTRCKSISFSSSSSYADTIRRDVQIYCRERLGHGIIDATISSESDDIPIIIAELDMEIRSFRTKYDRLYKIPGGAWSISGMAAGLALGLKAGDVMMNYSEDKSKEAFVNITGTMLLLGILTVFITIYAVGEIKRYLYPTFTVAIGKDKTRFEHLADTRKWLYRSAILPVLGYAASLIFKR